MTAALRRVGRDPQIAPDLAQSGAGAWLEEPGFGVYVHIPFCRHRCHYCDFNTYEGQDHLHGSYVDALIAEIDRWAGPAHPASSVFFGGGTPTLLSPADLGRILTAVRSRVGLESDAEVTVEANPETIQARDLEILLEAGFNRISIGVQSGVAAVLAGLGRTHSAHEALSAVGLARAAGFTNINADLIYGSPWESPDDWRVSLESVIDASPDHVSAYALTVEEGTPLGTMVAQGRVADVDPDVQAERHGVADELLAAAGFERYEISNWSKPGRACRHNLLYWSAGDYLGFGAGAHAHLAGHRWWSVRLPRDYVAAVAGSATTLDGEEFLDADGRAGEALMLGLRLSSGVSVDGFERRFGSEPLRTRAATIDRLEKNGLLERSGSRLRLTRRATLLANGVVAELL